LLGLDTGAVQMALGIASSMASGMVSNFGSMTKPLHAGLASRNGVLAAKLAQNGFTANSMILERPKGFFEVYCRDLSYDPAPMESLGASLELVDRGIRIKPYPCGGLTHSAIDALLEMRARYDIAPESIEAIKVGVTQQTYNMLVSYVGVPETGLQGKFSMPYILARALIDGKVSLDTFTDEAVRDSSVKEVAEKIYMEHDPELKEGEKGGRPTRVVIRLKDGGTLSQRVDYPKGSKEAPLNSLAMQGKFVECAVRAIRKEAANQVVEYLGHLEDLDDLEPLCRLLIGENKE
jgi:2-methylcitrate dehydratase PrpD